MKLLSHIYQEIKKIKATSEFMPTGLSKLDHFLDGGFTRKELIVLGGFTGSGKSFLGAQIFANIAKSGFKSAYFSLEISCPMIVSRLVGQIANIKPTRIMYGLLNDAEEIERMKAKARISPYENFMHFSDEIYDINVVEEAIKNNEYDFAVVDFIQNVSTSKQDEYSSMTKAALAFQKMAKKYNCCVLVVSQLSNSAAKTGAMEYKGSGGIAMVADVGFFITREEDNPEAFYLAIKKNRRGISGITFNLKFIAPGGMIVQQTYEKA